MPLTKSFPIATAEPTIDPEKVNLQNLVEAIREVLSAEAIKITNLSNNLLAEIYNDIAETFGADHDDFGFDNWWTAYLPKIQKILDGPGLLALRNIDLSSLVAQYELGNTPEQRLS